MISAIPRVVARRTLPYIGFAAGALLVPPDAAAQQDEEVCFAHDADAIGDVSGDGFPDLAIENVRYGTYGTINVLIYSPRDRKILMDVPGSPEAGYVLCAEGAGDLDGDGIHEVGVHRRVRSFERDADDPTHLRILRGGSLQPLQDREGDGFVLGGDFDGDARADIVVLVRDPTSGFRSMQFEGSAGSALPTRTVPLDRRMVGAFVPVGNCDDQPGSEIALVEDSAEGRRVLVYSPRRGEEVASVALGDLSPYDGVGVRPVGDQNGDGVLDIAVALYDDSTDEMSKARVRVVSGRDCELLVEATERSIDSVLHKGWGRAFASGVASIHDLTGDGVRELAIGMDCYALSIGGVAIFSGANGGYVKLVSGEPDDGHFGGSVQSGIDWNGDGTEDWWVCSQPFGGHRGRGGLAVYSGRDGELLERILSVADLVREPAEPK